MKRRQVGLAIAVVLGLGFAAAGCGGGGDDTVDPDGGGADAPGGDGPAATGIKTVFIILMENHDWSEIKGSSSAPYLNGLLTRGAHAENYKTPPGLHPSEPNYIWLEAGSNLGITDDNDPASHHLATHDHLSYQLEQAGISWRAYAEGISGDDCPLTSSGTYGVKHTPQLFFDDVTDGNSASSTHCKEHVRPYSELAVDLSAGTVARYNFITPDMCHDMHGVLITCTPGLTDLVRAGDDWLSVEVPRILASAAYADHGLLIITWDEGSESLGGLGTASDGPMGMIVLSPQAKVGYSNTVAYTHSATLKTMQAIFGLSPPLGDAATSNDLRDLFQQFP